jgi:hypothetical protein
MHRKASKVGDYRHCSYQCRRAAALLARPERIPNLPRVKSYRHDAKRMRQTSLRLDQLATPRKFSPLTPTQAAQLRGVIARDMVDHINAAHEVLAGTRTWTPVQANLFKTLMAKVVPDLSASYSQKEITIRDTKGLSIADLEAIVAGAQPLENVLEHDPEALPAPGPINSEPRGSGARAAVAEPVQDPA